MVKVEELLEALKKRDEDKNKNTVLWVLAIIGAVAAVGGIAYAVYRYFAPTTSLRMMISRRWTRRKRQRQHRKLRKQKKSRQQRKK